MKRKRMTAARPTRSAGGAREKISEKGKKNDPVQETDRLSELAKEGDEAAFLSLVRFHSTFNPIPLTPERLLASGLDDTTRDRLAGRLQRKEDRLLRPFPSVDMVFWEEEWVQKTLDRFLWKKRGGERTLNGAFVKRLWEASREGAMLQLRIYRKAAVTPTAWVRVKYPHFANLGLSDAQMFKIARSEGCRFGEGEFLAAARRFSRRSPLSGRGRTAPPR
ncbi:MAG TPA: hypothetical protein VFU42_10670 [Candidatus Deferrimicrobiaceae bacterium]|nr:hypothetical protein [Candidatus Deferrimicrobiaceae bacterium]